MDSSVVVWLLVLLSLVFANLPWFSEKLLFLKALPKGKTFFSRLVEWFAYYLVIGFIALGFETKLNGVRHDQGWEFYVVTFCLFLVFSLPGVIFHIDLKHHLRLNNQ